MAPPKKKTNIVNKGVEPKKEPLLGKPVKVVGFKGSPSTKCSGCVSTVRNAIMFEYEGHKYCTRSCLLKTVKLSTAQ